MLCECTNLGALQAIPPELRKKTNAAAIVSDIDDGTGPDEDLPESGKSGVIDVAKEDTIAKNIGCFR